MLDPKINKLLNPSAITVPSIPETVLSQRMQITDDLSQLLDILPSSISHCLKEHPNCDRLVEVVMDLGRVPEARFPGESIYLGDVPVSAADLEYSIQRVGIFSGDNRAGIERTLHRISAMRNRGGDIIGLTCRVGRAVFGTISMIRDLVETGQSLLLLGRPGVGKTTALREIARVLADDFDKRVVIIDTSNEIAGDGDIPHPAIGRARRMQVATPELQHKIMIEAVENHMPEVIVIDEIGTELEALAARTIAERGVQLVGTAHGNQIENLLKNPTLSDLIGGIQAVTLGDDEARRRGSQKTVLERKAPPTFEIAIEMLERQKWVIHEDVANTIDILLRSGHPKPQVRTVDEKGEVQITQEEPDITPNPASFGRNSGGIVQQPKGWRASGKMTPVTPFAGKRGSNLSSASEFDRLLDASWTQPEPKGDKIRVPGPNGEDFPVYIYPYGIGRSQLEQVIEVLNLPIVLTKDLDNADVVVALRSHLKNQSKLRQVAKMRQVPIHGVKSNTIPQITRTLQRLLGMDEAKTPETADLRLFTRGGNDDELEALEEARLAVEQIVLPKGQPVELLPRSPKVRKMQHELVEHYRLQSDSFGEEPNRRLRIYPA
ncbi:R3H domain-containing nucleic acid-binding protein [Crocosphaera watsonii WH 8501]|uniref:Single-stranded nucleic acid binding R3H n=1 Tax=Crocosphaera watsonii WH 8501 TaxID=165597 RepID=Q4C354_CROWT|nr:R3H domain-containing nucleic acid-binding protein [Crocosphaera watsonii]EAM50590.1 Single-stranded nucleic acid binding R3H [Crocosphaera watsonii WH 8501]